MTGPRDRLNASTTSADELVKACQAAQRVERVHLDGCAACARVPYGDTDAGMCLVGQGAALAASAHRPGGDGRGQGARGRERRGVRPESCSRLGAARLLDHLIRPR